MHVSLSRAQIGVTGKVLNYSGRYATHRQMRAERVAKDVNTRFYACLRGYLPNQHLNLLLR
jgi:hypothetical protein